MILKTKQQLKAYIHPVRISILKILIDKERTISEVAEILNVHPANLSHHFQLLKEHGLINQTRIDTNGRNVLKYYKSSAKKFKIEKSNPNSKKAALSILKDDLINTLNSDLNDKQIFALISSLQISDKNLLNLEKDLTKLIKKYQGKETKDGTSLTLNASIYPSDPIMDHLPDTENLKII